MKRIIQMDSTALITFAYERGMENGNIFHDYTIWREIRITLEIVNMQEVVMEKAASRQRRREKKTRTNAYTHTHLVEMVVVCCIQFAKNIFVKLDKAHVGHTGVCYTRTHTSTSVFQTDYVCLQHSAFTKTRRTQSAQGMCYSNSITKCCTGRRAFISHIDTCVCSCVCKIPNEEIRPAR